MALALGSQSSNREVLGICEKWMRMELSHGGYVYMGNRFEATVQIKYRFQVQGCSWAVAIKYSVQ